MRRGSNFKTIEYFRGKKKAAREPVGGLGNKNYDWLKNHKNKGLKSKAEIIALKMEHKAKDRKYWKMLSSVVGCA